MFKVAAVVFVLTSLLSAAATVDPEKPTRDQIRQAKLDFAAQKSRQRTNSRAQRKFVKSQRKAWKRSLKPSRRHSRTVAKTR